VRFAIDTGLRKVEQFGISWADVDLARRELTVPKNLAKSGRARRVPIMPRSFDILTEYAEGARRTDPVWPNRDGDFYGSQSKAVLYSLQAAARTAGIDDLTWHDLKRTCGCRLLQVYEMTLTEVASWLGHRSTSVTENHYAFLGDDALHKALSRLSKWHTPGTEGEVIYLKSPSIRPKIT
jgi:integrase/recombinase XerD